jgi:hypothetical protein
MLESGRERSKKADVEIDGEGVRQRKGGGEREKEREETNRRKTTAKVVSIDCVVVCSRLYCAVTNLAEGRSLHCQRTRMKESFTQQARERYPGRVLRGEKERDAPARFVPSQEPDAS